MSEKIFADALARAGDSTQAEFLNDFAEALYAYCRDTSAIEAQIHYIVQHLNSNGRKMIKEFAESVEVVERARPEHEAKISELWKRERELEQSIERLQRQREELESYDN